MGESSSSRQLQKNPSRRLLAVVVGLISRSLRQASYKCNQTPARLGAQMVVPCFCFQCHFAMQCSRGCVCRTQFRPDFIAVVRHLKDTLCQVGVRFACQLLAVSQCVLQSNKPSTTAHFGALSKRCQLRLCDLTHCVTMHQNLPSRRCRWSPSTVCGLPWRK